MIAVDRLSLRLAGVSRDGAQDIARMVAEKLAAARGYDTDTRETRALMVKVEAKEGEPKTELAERIAGEILRSLERSLG